jgi:hypothetical protein
MNAQELRIGNLVTVDNPESHPNLKGVVLEVTSIHESGNRDGYTHGVGLKHLNQVKNQYYESYSQFSRFIQPIELTEELVYKAGFLKSPGYLQDYINGIAYQIEINCKELYLLQIENQFYFAEDYDGFIYVFGDDDTKIALSLHKLQNLVYALTGKELTLNV